jgi:outer membrane protein assembly factor BamD (BamD/ComL family)
MHWYANRHVPAWVLSVSLASSAIAQNQYTLSEQDTWKQTRSLDPNTPEGNLAEARTALAAGDAKKADELASAWIEKYERHPLMPEAYLLRGDALVAQYEEYAALYDYEYVARMYAGSEAFVTALEREFKIAKQYAEGGKRKLWGIRWVSAEEEAEELLIRIQERLPGSRLAELAGMELADYYFNKRMMGLAVDAYALFIENYPRSEQVSKARRRLIYAHLASFKGPEFDARGLNEAKVQLQELSAQTPVEAQRVGADALLTRIDESNAAKMLETARWYWRSGNAIATEQMIRRLVQKHQRSVAAAEALRMVPEILPHLPRRILDQAPNYEAMRAALLDAKTAPVAPDAGDSKP